MASQQSGREPAERSSDVLGGPDRPEHEDELGGPDRADHEDELGGPDPAGRKDVLGGPDPGRWTAARHSTQGKARGRWNAPPNYNLDQNPARPCGLW
jgi:hypothetical protein